MQSLPTSGSSMLGLQAYTITTDSDTGFNKWWLIFSLATWICKRSRVLARVWADAWGLFHCAIFVQSEVGTTPTDHLQGHCCLVMDVALTEIIDTDCLGLWTSCTSPRTTHHSLEQWEFGFTKHKINFYRFITLCYESELLDSFSRLLDLSFKF